MSASLSHVAEEKGPAPEGKFDGFDHIHFWVSNAKQVAAYYCTRFGYEPVAYRGLETQEREVATHVVRQNNITIAFSSALNPQESEIGRHVMIHGDGVRDVSFRVDDCRLIYNKAVSRGAKSIMEPTELKDEYGTVIVATIATYGDTVHTLVQRSGYSGVFLPGYRPTEQGEVLNKVLPPANLQFVDHCVGNQPDGEMKSAANFYKDKLDFYQFWSVDDKQIHTKYSALRSIVMTDYHETVKMPINEPAQGLKKSQIQEYVDYYGGPGVQHIALRTENIIETVTNLRARGVEFLKIPASYYTDLRERLSNSPVRVKEDLDMIEQLHILVDFDDQGYLLQLFTRPVEDRPTFFWEVIQRNNHQGFGAGNFKSLFEAIELEQAQRNNL